MPDNKKILFEYQKMVELPGETDEEKKEIKEGLKAFLNEVWGIYKAECPKYYICQEETLDEADEDISKKQPFLFFDGNKFKPKNYIGFIKYKDYSFNLYPKICETDYRKYEKNYEEATDEAIKSEAKHKLELKKHQINRMILLWQQYSDNVILPKINTGVDEIENCDFMDFLIYQFAKYTSDLMSVSIYQHYEEISEETSFLKGKLNFSEYIKNCACGKAHRFHCTYDSFEMNNKFNQIIKYTAKSLLNVTSNEINRNYLNDIIFTLDEVDDVVCTYSDCEKVYINRFMGDFISVLEYCKLFLKNSVTVSDSGEFNNYAFLFRTEVLFEDFITNFAKEKLTGVSVVAQSKEKLDNEGHFKIKPDLKIEENGKTKKIIDIKYKKVNTHQNVSSADIYQCITYAVKLGCSDVTLLYPAFKDNQSLNQIKIDLPSDTINFNFKFIDCCPEISEDEELKDNESLENKILEQISWIKE